MFQVCLIIGICGACRSSEMLNLRIQDVEKHSEKLLLIKLLETKTKINRSFVIREEYCAIINKYIALRPDKIKTDRILLQYLNGKCKRQPMGINKIGEVPKKIAQFLNLEDVHLYTGHCLRRTSATLLSDSGADLTSLKRHGGWRSNTVAESYIEDSIENKTKICNNIIKSINLKPSSRSLSPQPSTSRGGAEMEPTDSWTKPSTTTSASVVAEDTVNAPPQAPSNDTGISNTQVNSNKTTINVPNKNVTFNLKNCSNFTFHF